MVVDPVGVDQVGAEVVEQPREFLARLARMKEARQRGETGDTQARRDRRGEIVAPLRRLVVGMVDGELGAIPAALAKQREMVEVHALGPALAMVPAMDPE